jgi:hypothetical protein
MSDTGFLGCAKSIYLLGESHCLPFRNVLLQPTSPGDIFLARIRFMQIFAANFMSDTGLHPDIVKALQGEQVLDDQGAAMHLTKDRLTHRAAEVSDVPVSEPTLVLFGGDLDVFDILRQIGEGFDFELPDDPGYGVNQNLTPIPSSVLQSLVTRLFVPFFAACKYLKSIGFRRVMVHTLPPRIRDAGQLILPGTAQTRAKLTVMANRVIRSSCAELNMPYIDIWDSITDDGWLRPNLVLRDGVHMSRATALLSMKQIIEKMQPAAAPASVPAPAAAS